MTILANETCESITADPFEFHLERLLKPRQANPVFVKSLKRRLFNEPRITIEKRKQYKAFWIVAAALFIGALAVFLLTQKDNRSQVSE
jgi:hypothetical protein